MKCDGKCLQLNPHCVTFLMCDTAKANRFNNYLLNLFVWNQLKVMCIFPIILYFLLVFGFLALIVNTLQKTPKGVEQALGYKIQLLLSPSFLPVDTLASPIMYTVFEICTLYIYVQKLQAHKKKSIQFFMLFI